MEKKTIYLLAAGVCALAVIGVANMNRNSAEATEGSLTKAVQQQTPADQNVKEFAIQSFVEMMDGKPKPQFNPNEIIVHQGDRVRLKVTVTKGVHDFNIDELNIHEATNLNEEKVIEFTADKAGEFAYYCNRPGHRAAGHWGTLKVL